MGVDTEAVGTGMDRSATCGVHDGYLPELDEALLRQSGGQCGGCIGAIGERIKHRWTQCRIGHVLRGHDSDAGARVGTSRRHRGLDELMMIPKAPVAASRATRENVMTMLRQDR